MPWDDVWRFNRMIAAGCRVLVAGPDREISGLISSVVSDAGGSVVTAGSLSSACRIASEEILDLIVLDYDLIELGCDLLAGSFIGSSDGWSRIFMFPRLIVLADRGSWGPCAETENWGPQEILWKPLDPQALYTKVCRLLASARAM